MALRNLKCLIVLVLAGCSSSVKPVAFSAQPLKPTELNHLYVVKSNFVKGGVDRVDLVEGKIFNKTLPAQADAVARWDFRQNQLLVLNRQAGNHLTIASPDFETVSQVAFPELSNPYDIVPFGDHLAHVSFLNGDRVRLFNLLTGKDIGPGIDLSEWNDADGKPESAFLQAYGLRLFVSLQQLDAATYRPSGDGVLVVADRESGEIDRASTRKLLFRNPSIEFKAFEQDLFLAGSGVVNLAAPLELDGGIERLWAPDGRSKGAVITEAELGGDIQDFEILTFTQAVAIVGTPDSKVVLFNPETGKRVGEDLLPSGPNRYSHVLADRARQLFYVTDRLDSDPSIRVFDFSGKEKPEHRIRFDLPPFKMVLAP